MLVQRQQVSSIANKNSAIASLLSAWSHTAYRHAGRFTTRGRGSA